MKKWYLLLLVVCGMMLGLTVTGCGKNDNDAQSTTAVNETTKDSSETSEDKSGNTQMIESQLKIFYDDTLYYALCYTTLEKDYPDISEATYIGDITKVCNEALPSADLETDFGEAGCRLYIFDYEKSVSDTKFGFICEYKDKKIYITEVSTTPFMYDNSEEEVGANIEESNGESDSFMPYPVGREVSITHGNWVYRGLLIQCKPEEKENLVELGKISKVCESAALLKNDLDTTFGTEGDEIYLYETENARNFYILHDYTWYEMTGAEVLVR
ncbi:MAG: hypothetical protein E7266_04360 [Lachnospiraceae bacterium]|nr:hypothetical protein [Lachnospiraceae bacterium]